MIFLNGILWLNEEKFKSNQVEEDYPPEETSSSDKIPSNKVEDIPVKDGNEPQQIPVAQPQPEQQIDPYTAQPIEMDEPLDPGDIGKVFILKKIYAKLLALDKILDKLNGEEFSEIRYAVFDAIQMFNAITVNYKTFDSKLDTIIKQYQHFLVRVSSKIKELINSRSAE